MEIKKSKDADLEGKRTTGFLLGIILVLAIFFAALEYSTGGSTIDFDEDLLRDLAHEEEDLIPLVTRKDLMMPAPEKRPKAPEVLKVTENEANALMPDEAGSDTEEEEKPLPDTPEKDEEESEVEEMPPPIANAEDNPLNFRIVEDLPQFPGGPVEFMKWLTKNLQYPKEAQRGRVQGRVVAQFIVNADGSISDLKIVTPLDPACDREVLRVLGTMPSWKAGSQNGKPCRTMVAIPIVFKL